MNHAHGYWRGVNCRDAVRRCGWSSGRWAAHPVVLLSRTTATEKQINDTTLSGHKIKPFHNKHSVFCIEQKSLCNG